MSERRESPSTESVELVLEEHDLLFLLLDDVDHLALVGDGHNALLGVRGSVVAGSRLEINDLLSLVHLHAQVTSLRLKLGVFTLFVLDLLMKLLLLDAEGLKPVCGVLLELLDLGLKSLLVFLILLLVLALDDLLSLLGDSVQLHIESTLLVIFNLQVQSLDLVLDLLQSGLVLHNLLHVVDLDATLCVDLIVFSEDHVFVDEDGIFIVSGDWKLGHFVLALLGVDDNLEVKLELFLSVNSLRETMLDVLILLDDVLLLVFEVHDELTQVVKSLVVL